MGEDILDAKMYKKAARVWRWLKAKKIVGRKAKLPKSASFASFPNANSTGGRVPLKPPLRPGGPT